MGGLGGLRLRVWGGGLGFKVSGLGVRVRVQRCLGFCVSVRRVQGFGFVLSLSLRVQGSRPPYTANERKRSSILLSSPKP